MSKAVRDEDGKEDAKVERSRTERFDEGDMRC